METHLRILLLEDSKTDAKLIERLLNQSHLDFEFKHVTNKKDYLAALDEYAPDLILSDNSLPKFNATEALQLLRERSSHLPFILITGTVSEEFAANIMKLGADDYILKDRMTRLPAAIEAALEHAHALKEVSDFKYALDQSSIGVITDHEGIILYANDNFCKISGYTRDELIGHDHRVVNSGYHPAPYIKNLWATISGGNIWRGEMRNKAKDGSLFWVENTIVPFLSPKGKPYQYLCIGSDITERKIAEENLLRTQERFKQAQEIAHVGNWEIDFKTNLSKWSDEAYRIYGITPGNHNLTLEDWLSFIHPEDMPRVKEIINRSGASLSDIAFYHRIVRKDGSIRHLFSQSKYEFNKNGKPIGLYGVALDITDIKEAEEAMLRLEKEISDQKVQEQKRVIRAILNAQEKERNRIGQELHDNINQILASIKIFLSTADKNNQELLDFVRYPMELVDSSIREIRKLSHEQVTPLKDVQLEDLIQSQLDRLHENTDIEPKLIYDIKEELIADDLKLNIYRIVQEQLNNIVKYAETKKLQVTIEGNKKELHVVIADEGKGFNSSKKKQGIGLANMLNRVESFNGTMEIDTAPGKGCRINISIPLTLNKKAV